MLTADAGSQPGKKTGLLRNILSLGVVQIANYVFPFLTVPYVVRIIGPDKFGVINFSSAFIAYFVLLINFGFDLSATRAIAANRDNLEERNRIFNQVIFAKFFLLAVSIGFFLVSLFLMPQFKNEKLVAIFTFLICFSWVITPNWMYQGMQELSRIAVFNLSTKVIFTVVIFLIIKEKGDYIWQPLAISIAQIIVGIFSFVYAVRRYKLSLEKVKIGTILDLLWKERIIFFSMVVVNLYTTTNIVLLGFLQSTEQVGYYTAGYRLIMIVQSLISLPVSQALFPFIGSAFSLSKEKGLDLVRQVLPILTVVTGVAAVGLWLLGPFVMLAFYGNTFAPAIIVFRILSFLPIIIGWSNLLGVQTMINLKMDKLFFRITAFGAVASLGLNFLLVSRMGFVGSAWCWLLTEILITLCMYIALRRQGIQIVDKTYFTPKHLMKYLKPILITIQQKINK